MKNARALSFGAALCLVALAPVAPVAAQDPPASSPDARIAPGVKAGGVDVGGLTVDEASAKLEQTLGEQVRRDVVLKAGGAVLRLDAETAKLQFDTVRTAKRAFYAKAPDQSAGGGVAAGTDVPLALTYSKLSVRGWLARESGKAYRAPRNAELRIGLKRLFVRRSKTGLRLDTAAAETLIGEALVSPSAAHELRQKLSVVKPTVTYKTLQQQYSTVITVSKSEFRLRLFKHLKLSKTYGVAVGQPAYPTPVGRFRIQNKQVNPVWSVPNSPWAGELGGTTVAGGSAANPLKARWMGIANGVGIHGTGQEYSIGSAASHGCIRMRVADVIDLYPRVPVGTTVVIR